jgi:hypothetical protein
MQRSQASVVHSHGWAGMNCDDEKRNDSVRLARGAMVKRGELARRCIHRARSRSREPPPIFFKFPNVFAIQLVELNTIR